MSGNVKPIPEGYHSVTPYLIIKGAAKALDFYQQAFGAKELDRMAGPEGKIMHAEMRIGDSMVMLADEHPEMNARSPESFGGSPVMFKLFVEDVDAVFNQALAAGATVERPLADEFYGDRSGGVKDPFGYSWYISTHKEDVSPEEMQKRMAAMASAQQG